jgi:hypothetical protein
VAWRLGEWTGREKGSGAEIGRGCAMRGAVWVVKFFDSGLHFEFPLRWACWGERGMPFRVQSRMRANEVVGFFGASI